MRVGPKPQNQALPEGAPLSSGSALTTTPCCCRSRESWFVSANDGISVTKWTEAVAVPAGFFAVLEVALELGAATR